MDPAFAGDGDADVAEVAATTGGDDNSEDRAGEEEEAAAEDDLGIGEAYGDIRDW